MASTTKCKDCKGVVSRKAKACPHCGRPARQGVSAGAGCAAVLLLVFVGMIALGALQANSPNPPGPPAKAESVTPESTPPEPSPPASETPVERDPEGTLHAYLEILDAAGVNAVVRSVSVRGSTATITVANEWHAMNYQVRYQAAQNLWQVWAGVASPTNPDAARIVITDYNGNEVGGSRVWGGSMIWVQK